MDDNNQYGDFDDPEGEELSDFADNKPDMNRAMESAKVSENPGFDELDVQEEYQEEVFYEEPQERADGYPDVVLYDDEYAEEPEYIVDPEGIILEEEVLYEVDGGEAHVDTDKGTKIDRVRSPKTTSKERSRFYNLPPERKQHYHQNRVESIRRQREEANHILSIPTSQATPEIFAKAQEILEKQSKETEKYKMRYQNMSVDERQELRRKQAAAKKIRQQAAFDPSDPYGVFAEMEKEVVERTKKAWKIVMAQRGM
ncbi:hypothetical protein CAEBREN_09541 [Caenorhabditis brenneri]|uniref:Uncharacterized protein n=1 Tax=Caenorhabditis brenneri TaxID=135651 RepID=G0NWX4_CAEBE|nr:hypothetical protein CAEBREN_09541 [Caenorhabditis brenneri]